MMFSVGTLMASSHSRYSILLLVVAILAVGPAAVLIRLADAPPISVAFYRLVTASITIGGIVVARGGRDLLGLDRRSLWLSIGSGALLALHFGSWISSLDHTSVANSVLIVTTQPVFAALLGVWFLKERVKGAVFGAIGLALAGSVIISGGNPQIGGWYGDLLALIGAVMAAAYLIVGRKVRRTVTTFGYVLIAYTTAAVVLGIWAVAIDSPLTGFPADSWMWMILAGLGPSVIGHTLYNRALKEFSAHTVSTTILGEPVVATALAAVVLAEYPSPWALIGAIPILVGVIWAIRLERSERIGIDQAI
ncbi:MAG: EamA family transporter [candidate division Zixibacteria bacterium]|nr:EamA family transporter [candidate division Zixibacteria bacterium]